MQAPLNPPNASEPTQKTLSLALQGGGAHGAFTWGVLDRLVEDERLVIDGISGTSAGAMNGAMLAYGLTIGGRADVRQLLRRFWRRIAQSATLSIFQPTFYDRLFGYHKLDHSPAYLAFDALRRMLSPYQLSVVDYNPLRQALSELIDFQKLRESAAIKLFVCATNVHTTKIRVFRQDELSPEVLLASACLPTLFQAVEIGGEHYWDGGFTGNPAMFPLISSCQANDIVLVVINPIRVDELPKTAPAIIDRMKDISFNATMMREMRTIALVTRLLDQHRLTGKTRYRRIYFHMIGAEEKIASFGVSSKLNADWGFLTMLFELGRETAATWLDRNFALLGRDSTVDLDALFL